MTVPPAIPFAISTIVLLWMAASAALAFTGSHRSGRHEVAPTRPGEEPRLE